MAEPKIAPIRSSSSAPAIILSLLILALIAAAVFYFNPHKVSELKVTSVDLYSPHTTMGQLENPAPGGMHILGGTSTVSEDDLYVVATIRFADKLRLPLFVTGATAHVTLADGTELESTALSPADVKRLEVIFPEFAQHAGDQFNTDDTVSAGQTRTGTIVLPFPGQSSDAWRNKKIAMLTMDLRNQGPQSARIP